MIRSSFFLLQHFLLSLIDIGPILGGPYICNDKKDSYSTHIINKNENSENDKKNDEDKDKDKEKHVVDLERNLRASALTLTMTMTPKSSESAAGATGTSATGTGTGTATATATAGGMIRTPPSSSVSNVSDVSDAPSTATANSTKSTTSTGSNANMQDISHGEHPRDYHNRHVWMIEPKIASGVLTADGMTQIAHHKYKAGSYTALDTFLSPNLWEPLTQNLLPIWLAPNLVTTFGGLFCLVSFSLSTFYLNIMNNNDNDDDASALPPPPPPPPRWLYFVNAFCMFAYYTLDCMDGKQARRTQSSSPLGQLFDHGMDCICNLCHIKTVQCIVLLPNHLLVMLQCSLQFAFWQAQWEEYYTGILPHATGEYCGVTEVNYGLALWSVMTGIFGRELYDVTVINIHSDNGGTSNNIIAIMLQSDSIQVRHIIGVGWSTMIISLIILSWGRVYQYHCGENNNNNNNSDDKNNKKNKDKNISVFFSAMTKFISPIILCCFASSKASLGLGLCFCLITIKLIVYSMAKMAYASLQLDIVFPYCITIFIIRHVLQQDEDDESLTIIYYFLNTYYLLRLMYWIHKAIHQLCERLQIPLFRIKPKTQ